MNGGTPARASDVFTLGLIVFRMMSLNVNPLLSAAEAAEFADPDDCVRRCEIKRNLESLYVEKIGSDGIDVAAIRTLDEAIAQCLDREPSRRSEAPVLWTALRNARVKAAEASPAAAASPEEPGGRRWFRLVTKGDRPEGRYIVAAEPATWRVTRGVVRASYATVADDEGDPFHRYFLKDPEVPGLEFRYSDSGWEVRVPEGAQNGFVLVRRSGEECNLTSTFVACGIGDELILFHRQRRRPIVPCTLVISE